VSELLNLMDSMSGIRDDRTPAIPDRTRDFIEAMTLATADEILEFLHAAIDRDWMEVPVWIRNLAYRLACLQRPDDPQLLAEASADLLCFGPDWDGIAGELKRKAERLAGG
jgi:hypothetical protein